MPGKIVKVLVEAGAAVTARQPLIVVEAMKMENEIVAGHPGEVEAVEVGEGDQVSSGQALVRLV